MKILSESIVLYRRVVFNMLLKRRRDLVLAIIFVVTFLAIIFYQNLGTHYQDKTSPIKLDYKKYQQILNEEVKEHNYSTLFCPDPVLGKSYLLVALACTQKKIIFRCRNQANP